MNADKGCTNTTSNMILSTTARGWPATGSEHTAKNDGRDSSRKKRHSGDTVEYGGHGLDFSNSRSRTKKTSFKRYWTPDEVDINYIG